MSSFDSPELRTALENIANGSYSAAFEALVPLAQAGNPKAQCNLANLYHFGWGANADGKKAVELYTAVARQNIKEEFLSGLAYRSLATIYTTGLPGIEPNPQWVVEFLTRARELGFEM